NSDVVIRRAKGNALYDVYDLPGMKEGQTNVRRDEGRHVRIAVLATHRFLEEFEGAAERLLGICNDYMDLADRMVRRAKASRGLIDAHLAESYGPDVDSLYYYVMNMKRLAVRLDELGLREGVLEVKRRVDAAIAELSGKNREPPGEERPRILALGTPARRTPSFDARGLVLEQRRDRLGQSVRIAGWDEGPSLLGHDLAVAR